MTKENNTLLLGVDQKNQVTFVLVIDLGHGQGCGKSRICCQSSSDGSGIKGQTAGLGRRGIRGK